MDTLALCRFNGGVHEGYCPTCGCEPLKDRVQRIGAQAIINMEHWGHMVTGVQEVLMKQTKFAMAKALADKLLEKFPTDFEPQSIEGALQIRVALDVILPLDPPCPSTS